VVEIESGHYPYASKNPYHLLGLYLFFYYMFMYTPNNTNKKIYERLEVFTAVMMILSSGLWYNVHLSVDGQSYGETYCLLSLGLKWQC
jgi:hypothetical protein